MEHKEALEAGFLKDKKVYLRLIVKAGAMIKDPKHIGYGGFDGAIKKLTLYYDTDTRRYVNPFESDEERKFFESVFGEDLSVYKKDSDFWENYTVKIVKDSQLVEEGMPFDLTNPKDMLAYKVLLTNKKLVVVGWDNKFDLPTYQYAFIDEGYEEVQKSKELDIMVKAGAFLGKMEDSTERMQDFLDIYHTSKKKAYIVDKNMSKEGLKKAIMNIISADQEGYLALVEDKNYSTKVFIQKCIRKGLIKKKGIGTYYITGVDKEYNYQTLVDEVKIMQKENTDPIYAKMLAQLNEDE